MTLSGKRPVAFAERAALATLIVGLALLLSYGDWLWRWDRVFYDTQRIRLDRESEANHNLNRLLDEPVVFKGVGALGKYLFRSCWA